MPPPRGLNWAGKDAEKNTMKPLLALALLSASLGAHGGDYYGTLHPPQAVFSPGAYAFSSVATPRTADGLYQDGTTRLRLGYKYSRYFSVEGEFNDFGRPAANIFASPASLSSAFRGTGFGVDTVATLPLSRWSFYGRMGAYHGDRPGFASYSSTLLADTAARGTRIRYGLGMRYDFTRTLGVRADLERYSTIGSLAPGDLDADQISVGVSWRF
jgi:hypothetical protein